MAGSNLQAIDPWLRELASRGGSDLLLIGGSAPRVRVNGELQPIAGSAMLSGAKIDEFVRSLLSRPLLEIFEDQLDVDFSVSWGDEARLRCSAFTERGETALSMRLIPSEVPTFEQLGLPPVAEWLAGLRQGFVLVTGPTGSGKSTTLASIIDRINESRQAHILTIEDPIEFVHHHKQSAVSQREIGHDSPSFARALRSALREDPDVLLVGEMRDIESIEIALTMAETGHLVFATLHTNDAAQTIDRIVSVFPDGRQELVRTQLAASLQAIFAQRLCPRVGGGMVAAYEVMVATPSVRNLIREGKTNQLQNILRTQQRDGMRTLEMSLTELIRSGVVRYDDALSLSQRPDEIVRELQQAGPGVAPTA